MSISCGWCDVQSAFDENVTGFIIKIKGRSVSEN